MSNSSSSFLAEHLKRFQALLDIQFKFAEYSDRLNSALIYSILNGGKRVRPLLIYATGLDLGATAESLDAPALAVELLHGYSLIHDDLPAMDNDDLRRGKPTCHIAFDEATAILAGDALQSLAFEILSAKNTQLEAKTQLAMIRCLAKAAGPAGMAAGQMLDLQAEAQAIQLQELEQIHHLKTGAIMSACFHMAGLAANCSTTLLDGLITIGSHLGLAFQIQDDILDIEGNTKILGKNAGSDESLNKSTYPKILGMEGAKLKFREEYELTLNLIHNMFPNAPRLTALVNQLFNRNF